MTTTVSAAAAILGRLQAVPQLTVYDGEVPTTPLKDAPGKVRPYAVLYMGAGRVPRSDRLAYAAANRDLGITFQVTCAAGTRAGASWAVDKTRTALTGQRLSDGANETRLKETTESQALKRDPEIPSDIRWYAPLLYRFETTT